MPTDTRISRALRWCSFTLLVATAACGGDPGTTNTPPGSLASVTVSPTTGILSPGGKTTLAATAKDGAGRVLTGQEFSWSSSADVIASVSSSGLVTAVAVGTATITATSGEKSGQATITVVAPVASVRLTPDSSDVERGRTRALTAVALGPDGEELAGRSMTFLSNNTGIATVNAAGVVTGVIPGTVTITATSAGKQAAVRVRVVAFSLNAIVETIRAQYNLPALSAAVVTRDGGTLAIGVSGTRRFGQAGNPVTLDDKWHLGSNTKTMTAFVAEMAVKAGLLNWNDLMTARYPELAPIVLPALAGTTLRRLATMQSGIVGNPGFAPTGTPAQQRSQVDTWAVQQAPAAAPGTYYYSNIAYQILGEIAARAFGTTYPQLLQDRLWGPLGITTGGIGPTTDAGGNDQPVGHSPSGSNWTPCEACDNSWAAGSGKAHMSMGDWARLHREILRADAGQSLLLSQAEARLLTVAATPINASSGYAYGWIATASGPRIVSHDGSNTVNLSKSVVYLDTGVAFLGAMNAGDPNGGVPAAAMNALFLRLNSYWQTGQ